MSKKGLAILLGCVFALSLTLFGCGGGGTGATSSKTSFREAFTGTWNLVEMTQDGNMTSADDLETLRALGMEVYVNLNADGTLALVMFGESLEGTWDATSATQGTVTMNNTDVDMTLDNSRLTFEQQGMTMVFEKGEAKEPPAKSASSAASSSSTTVSSQSSQEPSSTAEAPAAPAEENAGPAEAASEASSSASQG